MTSIELMLSGRIGGEQRAWLFRPGTGNFDADRRAEILSTNLLEVLVRTNKSFVLTVVPVNTGTRLALDRDEGRPF
jgi:hypothetical protein